MAAVRGRSVLLVQTFHKFKLPLACQPHRCYAYRRKDTPPPDPLLFKRIYAKSREYSEREVFPKEFSTEVLKGKISDKKPFKMYLEAGKLFAWCTCGHSRNQPLCDGTHKVLDGTAFVKTGPKFRPHRFKVEESGEYWLCNCKQTDNRPFCDGTHKRQDIQDAVRS